MRNLEHVIPYIIDNIRREIYARPLFLGGGTAPSGGNGGPPGGFIGYLPQTKIAFDETEAETDYIPPSGESLLDNLNRIRYRIKQLEDNGTGGGGSLKAILWSGNIVASGVEYIDFYGDVKVEIEGNTAKIFHPVHARNEFRNISSNSFEVDYEIFKILTIFMNGSVLKGSLYTYNGNTVNTTFTTSFDDEIIIEYLTFEIQEESGAYGNDSYGTSSYGGI